MPNVTATGGSYVYNEVGHAATGTATKPSDGTSVTPSPNGFTFTYTNSQLVSSNNAPVDADTYSVVAHFASTDPNYANASSSNAPT